MHTNLVFIAVVVALAVSAPVAAEQKPIIKPPATTAHDDESPKATQTPIVKPTGGPATPIIKPAGGPTKPNIAHDDESPKERVFKPIR